MNLIKLIPPLGICALLCPLAQAQTDSDWSHTDWADSAWYMGAGIGSSKAKLDESAIVNTLNQAGVTSVLINSDQRDTGYKLFMGKQINRNLSLEGGWFDLGRFGFDASTVPLGNLSGRDKVRGWNLDMLFHAPMTQQVSLYGRVGTAYARSNSEFSGSRFGVVSDPDGNDRKFSPKVGLGVEYKFSEALSMRGEVERYRINSAVRNRRDIDLYSLNLVYKFGRPAARAQVSVAPTPAAMPISETRAAPVEIARAPDPVAPKPVAVSEKVSFAAEALFDFDKAVVKPEGQTALDDLMVKLQGMNTEVMVTVGHTDSVGSDDYNQKLSLRRAEAVKAYLMSKGIDSARVFTEGKGEADPVEDNRSAEHRAKNRRVMVEVVGTRTVTR